MVSQFHIGLLCFMTKQTGEYAIAMSTGSLWELQLWSPHVNVRLLSK